MGYGSVNINCLSYCHDNQLIKLEKWLFLLTYWCMPCIIIKVISIAGSFSLQINGLPSMQLSHDLGVPPDPTNPYTVTKFGLTHDMLQILFKPTPVAADLSHHLARLRVGIKPGPHCDQHKHTMCVDYKGLQKLIDSRREFVNRGGYQRIYPSVHGERYSKLIQRMDSLIGRKFSEVGAPVPRTLWQVHHLYTALERLNYSE